jgi:pyruvate ferredoxin oxidoreductase delta subunit
MLVVNESKCVGCGLCVSFCPVGALSAWGLCSIDEEECSECLICIDYCPVDALEVLEESRV